MAYFSQYKPPLRIGLTGPIGSGKSVAAAYWRIHGIPLYDTDEVARSLLNPDHPDGHPALCQHILTHFRDKGLTLPNLHEGACRSRLREWIFQHPEDRIWLENCLHPRIRDTLLARSAAHTPKPPYELWAIPLLLENRHQPQSLYEWMHRIVYVHAPVETRVRRLIQRDGSKLPTIHAIIRRQIPEQQARLYAHACLDNTQTVCSLQRQIDALHARYWDCAKFALY